MPPNYGPKTHDYTQATSDEVIWRPIVRKPDPVPEMLILKNRVQLKEWEVNQNNIFHSYIYDRRVVD